MATDNRGIISDEGMILHVDNVSDFCTINGKDTRYTEIVVSYLYDGEIDFRKFKNVKKLSFPNDPEGKIYDDNSRSQFNHPLIKDNLPPNLEELYIGDSFNHPLDDLPDSIKILHIGRSYSHDLNDLPNGLHTLITTNDDFASFDHPIENLPCSIKRLELNGSFNQEVTTWPPQLEILQVGYFYRKPIKNLPASLKVLKMNSYDAPEDSTSPGLITVDKFPSKLEDLELPVFWNYSIDYPPNLRVFKTNTCFRQSINELPDTVEVIEMFGGYDGKTITKFPPNLRVIDFGETEDPPIHLLPDSVEELYISGDGQSKSDFNAYIPKYPASLKKVKYGHRFDRSIDSLPDSVTDIEFHHHNTTFKTKIMKYPKSLKRIAGNIKIRYMFDPSFLPRGCHIVSLDIQGNVAIDEFVA